MCVISIVHISHTLSVSSGLVYIYHVCCVFVQVLKDYKVSFDLEATAQSSESWRSRALQFVLSRQSKETTPKTGEKQLQRVASFDQLLALDNCLQIITGHGLNHFIDHTYYVDGTSQSLAAHRSVMKEDYPYRDAVLVAYCDQSSVNCTCMAYMIYHLHAKILPLWDVFHRTWNDLSLALKDCGHWPLIQMMVVVLNCPLGAWQSAAFWHQIKNSCTQYCNTANEDDILFQWLLPHILEDCGVPTSEVGDVDASGVFESLTKCSFMTTKGSKTTLGRWLSWIRSSRGVLVEWHSLLLVQIHACIQLGLVRKGDAKLLKDLAQELTQAKIHQDQSAEHRRTPVSRSNAREGVSEHRKSAVNTLHMSMLKFIPVRLLSLSDCTHTG